MELSKRFNESIVGVCYEGRPSRKYFDADMKLVDSTREAEFVSFSYWNPRFLFIDLNTESGDPGWAKDINNQMIDWMCEVRSHLANWSEPEIFDPAD